MNLLSYFKESNIESLSNTELKLIKKDLSRLDEFKDVKHINILESPIFYSDMEGQPIEYCVPSLLEKREDNISTVNSYVINKNTIFNDTIDILGIYLSPKTYTNPSIGELGLGIHLSPVVYTPSTFQPLREIRICFTPEFNVGVGVGVKYTDEDIINKFKDEILEGIDLIIKGELKPDFPYTQNILIRCSPRSIKNNKPLE